MIFFIILLIFKRKNFYETPVYDACGGKYVWEAIGSHNKPIVILGRGRGAGKITWFLNDVVGLSVTAYAVDEKYYTLGEVFLIVPSAI